VSIRNPASAAIDSKQFNAADVSNKLSAALDILAGIPSFGLFLNLNEKHIEGKVLFVD